MKNTFIILELLLIFGLSYCLLNSVDENKALKEQYKKPVPIVIYSITAIDSSELRMTGKYLYNLVPENAIIWDPDFWVPCSQLLVTGYDRFYLGVLKP